MDVAAKIFQIIPDPTFVVHIQEKHDVQNQALADLILQDMLQSRCGSLEHPRTYIVNQFAMYIIACVSVFHEFL